MCSPKPPKPKPAPLPAIEPPELQLQNTKRRRAAAGTPVGDRQSLRLDLGLGGPPSAGLQV